MRHRNTHTILFEGTGRKTPPFSISETDGHQDRCGICKVANRLMHLLKPCTALVVYTYLSILDFICKPSYQYLCIIRVIVQCCVRFFEESNMNVCRFVTGLFIKAL